MNYQIIQQPEIDLFAVWSTVVDAFVLINAKPQEIIDMLIDEERERITRKVENIVSKLYRDEKPYHQFTMTWEEALQQYEHVHGKPFDPDEPEES